MNMVTSPTDTIYGGNGSWGTRVCLVIVTLLFEQTTICSGGDKNE